MGGGDERCHSQRGPAMGCGLNSAGGIWEHLEPCMPQPLNRGRHQPRGLSRGCLPCSSGFLFHSPHCVGQECLLTPRPLLQPACRDSDASPLPPSDRGEAFVWELNPPEMYNPGRWSHPCCQALPCPHSWSTDPWHTGGATPPPARQSFIG